MTAVRTERGRWHGVNVGKRNLMSDQLKDKGKKICEPKPEYELDWPLAGAEIFAKPTAGGLARKTVYTFFLRLFKETNNHVRVGEVRTSAEETHEECVANYP